MHIDRKLLDKQVSTTTMIVIPIIKLQWIVVAFGFVLLHQATAYMEIKSKDIAGEADDAFAGESKSRFVRKTSELRDPYNNANLMSRFVELVIVYDKKAFQELNETLDAVLAHSKDIANIVNYLYTPLNVFVKLVGTIVWSDIDQIHVSQNSERTLANFLNYRRNVLVQDHPNDNAQLITGMQFEGGVLGKSLIGTICTYEYSGAVTTMQNSTVAQLASLLAHHLGQNLGMEQDADNCSCPDSKCIMTPLMTTHNNSTNPAIHWSSCSQHYISQSFGNGLDNCLRNKPKTELGPVCGNGVVEDGEDCDCSLGPFCSNYNPCCNFTSCTLYANASCATGSCCHIPTCQIKPMKTLCRDAVSECDPPEFCDGISRNCPKDVFKQNGVPCGNETAYCAGGNCLSHDDQCRLLWGHSGKMSDTLCYELNQWGNMNGNCGYFRFSDSYKSCAKEDVLCGMLHCTHANDGVGFGLEAAPTLSGKVSKCQSEYMDFGLDGVDLFLAPDGSKCGEDKMCFRQRCIPIDPVTA